MSPLYIGGKQEIVFWNCIPEVVGIELTGFQRNTDDSVLSRFSSITQYDSYTVLHSIMMTHDMNISWTSTWTTTAHGLATRGEAELCKS